MKALKFEGRPILYLFIFLKYHLISILSIVLDSNNSISLITIVIHLNFFINRWQFFCLIPTTVPSYSSLFFGSKIWTVSHATLLKVS